MCVCVCVRIHYNVTDKEQPQVQRNVKCSPFPPKGDVRLPTRKRNVRTRYNASINVQGPLGAQKRKERMKSIQSPRERVQKAAIQRDPNRILEVPSVQRFNQRETEMPCPKAV